MLLNMMTDEEFETKLDSGELDMQYAEYIYENALIGNGDMLIEAMESGAFYESFKVSFFNQQKAA